MKTGVERHLDEGTLLRLAARDLREPEALAARKHVEECAACRAGLAGTRRFDRSLKKLAETLRSRESQNVRGRDAGFFEFVGHLFDISGEADEPAERILRAARAGADELAAALRALDGKSYRGFALMYAAQRSDTLVAEDPNKALTLARLLFDQADSLPPANQRVRISTPAPRQAVQAEAALLESQALLQKGEAKAAREAVRPARRFFAESGDLGFGAALCDYYDGSAASFQREYALAEKLLKRALAVFSEFGQDSLVGRAEGALGVLLSNRGDYESALLHFERSLGLLDVLSDSQRFTITHNNRATTLMRLGRFNEARATFAKALNLARRNRQFSHVFFIRTGLAELDFRRGEYRRALRVFSEIVREASPLASKVELLFSRLYAAECHARLGNYGPMAADIEAMRHERQANRFTPSPALGELFMSLDQGTIGADLIAHVREYLQDEENGVRRAYRPLRRASSP
ncbi:MAG: tetratricopeptide repeat protein [Acidobacteriota bacterium]